MISMTQFENLVMRASAGTGKTFQLSNRYLGLAAAGVPVDHILATDTGGDDLHYSPLSGYGSAPVSSLSIQALTDVEAISFVPSEGVRGGSPGVRILRWIEIK